ncbi:type III secretion system translocon subunit SctE [Providencia huaxiensis]|uniref:Type III secretion system translocon subunit SctE n=1 Tax=Providencia rettgeri TaxID=587 RepID=A0A3R8XE23_PRORE|nr:type III secretion system translocon subunit SctE [Providencia rettgeri]ELR5219197.1 type III secretion system translocon subunit SctE [Providencia rettgeri]MBV2188761.1 type III secretion system translocon subunit SctE [Providencia rettgeri]HEC8325536.1 type III secretion system translocon subunit SctE [Providencia rettgeri]
MGPITNSSNERINNIHTFLQGSNPIGLGDESIKAVLALEMACEELASTEQMKRSRIENAPQLPAPKNNLSVMFKAAAAKEEKLSLKTEGFNATSVLVGSLTTLRQLLHEGNISELANRLQLMNIESNALREKGNDLLNSFVNHTDKTNALNNEASALIQERAESKARLAHLQSQQGGNQEKIKQQIAAENTKITNLGTKIDDLLELAGNYAKDASEKANKLNQFIDAAPRRVEIDGEKWENALALLTMLTGQLKKAMNEDSIRNMKEQEAVMATINEASRKDSDKKAKEAEEAQRKADEANKAASCTSKIFSYVMLAVSVIATVATFGAAAPLTLAVAAIGIAISVADIVLEETGQSSLMQMLASEISSAVTDMLMTFGVPEEKAKQIGSIVGMIMAAIAFLALSLASMSSFVKNIGNIATNAVKMLAKNAGTLLKSIIKSMPNGLMNALGNIANGAGKVGKSADNMAVLTKFSKLADSVDDLQQAVKTTTKVAQKADDMRDIAKAADKVADQTDSIADITKSSDKAVDTVKTQSVAAARLEVGMKGTGAALTVANTATTGGLNLHAAGQIRDMKEMLAGLMLNSESIQVLDELLKNLLKSMSQNHEKFEEMFSGMLTSLNQSGQAKANMLKTARFA